MENKKDPLIFSWGGRNSGKTVRQSILLQNDFEAKWHLSTEGFYFKYRPDKYNLSIRRATLYRSGNNEIVDDVRVSEGYGFPEKTHHQVINYFEAKITLGQIK